MKARVLVDAVPELKGSLTSSLDPLLEELTAWMAAETTATPDECEKLRRCGRLRNKLFHAEFSRASGQLVHLDVELRKESVKRFTWGDGPITAETIIKAIEGGGVDMSKTKTEEGRVFGWLLNACQTGALGAAASMFDEAVELLERILLDWTDAKIRADEEARSDV